MTALNKLRTFTNIALKAFGYELVPVIPTATLATLDVDQIIDIGVYKGTDFLLEHFSDKEFYFIEPNPAVHPYIKENLCKKYNGKLFDVAASDDTGYLEFIIDGDQSRSASPGLLASKQPTIRVAKQRLDDILSDEVIGRALLKIDVEGFELDVLRGAKKTLLAVDAVIVEVRFSGKTASYAPQELFDFMSAEGFAFKTIIGEGRRKKGLNYCDCYFVRSSC